MKKVQNDFHVGRLVIKDLNNQKKHELIKNGAIGLDKNIFSKETNIEGTNMYDSVFTIFLKSNGKYICLHDGKTYSESGEDYCTNLDRFSNIFPLFYCRYSCNTTVKQALHLFDLLFKKGLHQKYASLFPHKKTIPLDSLHIGCLSLCLGFHLDNIEMNYEYHNIPRFLMLSNSDASLIVSSQIPKYEIEQDGYYSLVGHYKIVEFRTLFLLYEVLDNKDIMYNLHNFGFYNHKCSFDPKVDSFSDMIPLKEVLEESEIICRSEEISYNKALQLYRTLEKRNQKN